ncbi:DUF5819 family protein [Streptomyces sp. WMMC940]|uniref:DUF5819 family protein n=1 Tax=Streptomyces sp. WMMC940 TaxID=3015153 RepID=UPI0022B7058E|nr:DUF5819 family protein [Streptomyces sp. WMMC940]MCZ7459162.1 DUF5819 family protein [Streptomyces sp. WMMC940]
MDSYDGDGAEGAGAVPPVVPGAIRDSGSSGGPHRRGVATGEGATGDPGTTTTVRPPDDATGAGDPGEAPLRERPSGGIAALSLPYQVVAAVALGLVAVLACVHLAMVFLHVAPSNTLTKQHGKGIDEWIYPEFEQNWKLFAPNPLQQNIAVQVRAEVAGRDGSRRTSDWIDLSAEDGEAIRGNLLPSHVHQNELRRGWDFYSNSHTDDNKPNGLRGQLSERYVRRIVMTRLDKNDLGGRVERIQLRSTTRSVKAPPWSREKIDTRPYYRVLPWWTVTTADLPLDVRNGAGDKEAGR